MDQSQSDKIGQQGMDLGTSMAPLAPAISNLGDKISPFVEMLLSLITSQQKQPAYTSTQMGQPAPTGGPIKNQMMGQQAKPQQNPMY